jgi:hypothetical protein
VLRHNFPKHHLTVGADKCLEKIHEQFFAVGLHSVVGERVLDAELLAHELDRPANRLESDPVFRSQRAEHLQLDEISK